MRPDRRTFLKTASVGAAGATLAPTAEAAQPPRRRTTRADADGPVLLVGDDIAVAQTTSGRVRGFVLRGIHHFLGVPYGADTSGANRFMPPQPPTPWTDVYPALWWGNSAPQNMENRYASRFAAFRDHWNYDDVSEDCLRLNVWTPALADGRKRPVMFWIHGGGFVNGNAIEQDGYDGENLARFGDVVFVSINHRLGPLGYCNLAGVGGAKYAASGNVGMLDIVAALQWVRDNIAGFGGDPGNVTIMGQSGGGAKVCTLTAMPAAKGLFHKAVVLSGASLRMGEKAYAEKLGAYVLAEAGLSATEVDKLQALPWKAYYEIATKAQRKLAADVPMIICSTLNEQSMAWVDKSFSAITLPQVVERLKERAGFGPGYGDRAQAVVDAYAKAYPDKSPADLWSLVSSNRQNVVALADAKSAQPAPVFVSWFAWQPPLFDGRIGAFHCVDICFWFHNTDLMLTHTGGGGRPRRLAEKMAGALVQFMRTGSPNGPGLVTWPRYTPAVGETLVLDDTCVVRPDPDREARKALPSLT